MAFSAGFIEFGQTPSPFVYVKKAYVSREHPFMQTLRESMAAYHLQSPAHFASRLDVVQAAQHSEMITNSNTKIEVRFSTGMENEFYICRPTLPRHKRKNCVDPTTKVEVMFGGRFTPLHVFLDKKFPKSPHYVTTEIMQAWWAANGKVFPWAKLPTELKEQVIQHGIHQPCGDVYRNKIARWNIIKQGEKIDTHEVVDKLADWAALLTVSHQVRSITLRLCFMGSSYMNQGKGFNIIAESPRSLNSAFRRLGAYYQLVEPHSIPVDAKTQILADCYKEYPKLYPQLKQYATFRHGLRMVALGMNFREFMHFFNVKVGGFDSYLRPNITTYEVFEQLPHLEEVVIRLPLRPYKGWVDLPGSWGPRLFHVDAPCPRMLHRVIYERIAEVLAIYKRVTVYAFGDAIEQARFIKLRKAARAKAKAKWTVQEYEELYAECGGGIELENCVQPGLQSSNEDDELMAPVDSKDVVEPFFPPKCRCEVKCLMLYNAKEGRRRRW